MESWELKGVTGRQQRKLTVTYKSSDHRILSELTCEKESPSWPLAVKAKQSQVRISHLFPKQIEYPVYS